MISKLGDIGFIISIFGLCVILVLCGYRVGVNQKRFLESEAVSKGYGYYDTNKVFNWRDSK